MPTIIAIGGGELRDLETLSIDKAIIKRTGKESPRVLFIPTASSDAVSYWNTFNKIYGKKLGCHTDVLYLLQSTPDVLEIERSILSADAIYVGGGNTLKMMKVWRRLGIDDILRKAYHQGIILSGLSAGANCWFRYATSDSRRFHNPDDLSLIRVRGLGLIDAVISPHHVAEPHRRDGLISIMRRTPGVGIALDDHAAIEIIDDGYRILTSRPHSTAHRVYIRRGELHYEEIQRSENFQSLQELLSSR